MATAEITALTTVLQEINSLASGNLVRAELGPFLSFESGRAEFEKIQAITTRLLGAQLEMSSVSQITNLTAYAVTLRDYLRAIAAFAPQGSTPTPQERDSLLANLRGGFDALAATAADVLSLGSRPDIDLSEFRQQAQAALDDIRRLDLDARAAQEKAVSDANAIVGALQSAAAAGGVARHETLFDKEAKSHKEAATRWLWMTGILAVATFVFALLTLLLGPGIPLESSTGAGIQHAVTTVLVFSVLASSVVWSGRSYRAHQHNYIINRHRQIALTTFETFAKAAGDDLVTKNAVLRLATESVFAAQQTGYVSQDPDPSPGAAQILEIVRSVSK